MSADRRRCRVLVPALALALMLAAALPSGCTQTRPTVSAVVHDDPQHARELYRAGVALAATGDLTRAEQYLAMAHRESRDRASLVALLAVCIRAARLRSAVAYAQPYLLAVPSELPLLSLVATLHFALGELDEAERLCMRALRIDEARAETHYLLARVLNAAARRGSPGASKRDRASRIRALQRHLARYLVLSPQGSHAQEARAELTNLRVAGSQRGS